MADQVSVDASEIRRLGADFELARHRVGKEVAAAVRSTTKTVAELAKQAAPVRTGELKSSIGFDFRGSGNSKGMAGAVFTTAPHGWFVETGTSRMAPQPYIQPSLEAVDGPFHKKIESIIDGVL